MEIRWGLRQPLTARILVDFRPEAFGRGIVRNISASGVLIETALTLPKHVRVELVFATGEKGAIRLHRLGARVARTVPDGVALAYEEFNPPAYRALKKLALRQSVSAGAEKGRKGVRRTDAAGRGAGDARATLE